MALASHPDLETGQTAEVGRWQKVAGSVELKSI
jgi:hypothetical protein